MAAKPTSRQQLPVTRAAVLLLREVDGQSLHYKEIAERALNRNLISVSHHDEIKSVATSLYRHVRKKGSKSWFRRVGPGKFQLTDKGWEIEVWRFTSGRRKELAPAELAQIDELTWKEAAEVVLFEAREPLTAAEIVARIWESDLRPRRDTKWAARSMGNTLAEDIRTCAAAGKQSKFRRIGKGRYEFASRERPKTRRLEHDRRTGSDRGAYPRASGES